MENRNVTVQVWELGTTCGEIHSFDCNHGHVAWIWGRQLSLTGMSMTTLGFNHYELITKLNIQVPCLKYLTTLFICTL